MILQQHRQRALGLAHDGVMLGDSSIDDHPRLQICWVGSDRCSLVWPSHTYVRARTTVGIKPASEVWRTLRDEDKRPG